MKKKSKPCRKYVKSKELLEAAGYVNASDNDLKAIQDNKKVGLVYH